MVIAERTGGIFIENQHHNHAPDPHILSQLSQPEQFQPVAELFAQLGDTTRLRIFWLLCHRESCGIHIAESLGMSTQAIAHHLRLLRDSGLVCTRREGKEVYYHACATPACDLLHQMMEAAMDIACPRCPCQEETLAQQIHRYLMTNLSKHITIDDLSRLFLVNPTTLKEEFKATYGLSIAAHMRNHRMEKAGKLLLEGNMSISQIAESVGYESASKFSAAFKAYYGVNPSKYTGQKPLQPCSCE